jgi:hypothetical protein
VCLHEHLREAIVEQRARMCVETVDGIGRPVAQVAVRARPLADERCELRQADGTALAQGWVTPLRERVRGADRSTDEASVG